MKRQFFVASLIWAAISGAKALELPVTATDYYSLQIASGKDIAALERAFERYAHLPFARIERRGALFTLRAGFWTDESMARDALSEAPMGAAFVRVAVFRPDAIVKRNWGDQPTSETVSVSRPSSAIGSLGGSVPQPSTPAPVVPMAVARPLTTTSKPLTDTTRDTLRPFNQEDFSLAFDALISSRDFDSSLRIAQQSVRERPGDRDWRRKLARVADWAERPGLAAEHWQVLFAQGDRSEETVSAVIRLAPLLEQPAAVMLAWEYRADQSSLTPAEWSELFFLYESLTEPKRGSQFFEAQFLKTQSISLLDYAARLAANGGDENRAQSLYLQRLSLAPFSMDALMWVVVSFIRSDNGDKALAVMQAHLGSIPAEAVEFWRLLGELAWLQSDFATAQQAYARVTPVADSTAADWSRLIFLVRQQHPAQAAELAWKAYRRFNALDQLKLGLEIFAGLGDLASQARIFGSLTTQNLRIAEQDARFLLMRAQYQRLKKQPDLAWADLARALTLTPNDPDVALSALWFLVDEQRSTELTRMVATYAQQAVKDNRFWLVFAAGSQVLNRSREAVLWYGKAVSHTPDDPLLLLNFADAIERSQNVGMAARIRRHAWLLLKQKLASAQGNTMLPNDPLMLTEARLALLNEPGDPGLRRVRELVNQLRGVTTPENEIAQLNALILGWAILKEQFPNARSWMWLRYARQAQNVVPVWGVSQVALKLDDTESMAQILDRNDKALPIYNKYDTAYALGDVQQALDTAFQGMSQPFGDEPLYDRFRQHAPLNANYVQLLASKENSGALDRQGLQFEGRLVLQPTLHAVLAWSRRQQSSSDANLASLTNDVDQLDSVSARWLGERDQTYLTLFRRTGGQSTLGLRATQSLQVGRRLSLEAGINYRDDSSISQPMSVAGYQDRLFGNLTYVLGKREYFRVSPEFNRYFTQQGDYLGGGQSIAIEAGYRVRTEYPDWTFRANWTRQNFYADGNLGAATLAQLPAGIQAGISTGTIDPLRYFVPEGGGTWGACVSMGENLGGQSLQTVYSKAWRPFADMCLSHNSVAGPGYSGVLGVAGSLTGEDHLSLQWRASDGIGASNATNRSLFIRYRHYF